MKHYAFSDMLLIGACLLDILVGDSLAKICGIFVVLAVLLIPYKR